MLRTLKTQTMTSAILKELREMIIDEELRSGEKINVDDLSKKLGASKIPIRESLKTLESQELVYYCQRKGWFVAKMDRQKVLETLEIQLALEIYIAYNLFAKLKSNEKTVNTIKKMKKANKLYKAASLRGTNNKALEENFRFHALYYSLYPNASLSKYMKHLWSRDLQFRREVVKNTKPENIFIEEHETIIQAVETRDTNLLFNTCTSHIRRVLKMVREIFGD